MEIWKRNQGKNRSDIFSAVNLCAQVNIKATENLFVEHLDGWLVLFSNYFDDIDFTIYAWIHYLFIDEENDES